MRSPNDKTGGFYTHITDVPAGLGVGSPDSRGDLLGKVHSVADTGAHLHLALVEIIGGAPGGRYTGVNLHRRFLDTAKHNHRFLCHFRPGRFATYLQVRDWSDLADPHR